MVLTDNDTGREWYSLTELQSAIHKIYEFATYLERFAKDRTPHNATMWLYRFRDRPKFISQRDWEMTRDEAARFVGYVDSGCSLEEHGISKFAGEAAEFMMEKIEQLRNEGGEKNIAYARNMLDILQDEELRPYIDGEKPRWAS
ncbi:MAG: hypothetical protein ABIB98_02375 [bacterium]